MIHGMFLHVRAAHFFHILRLGWHIYPEIHNTSLQILHSGMELSALQCNLARHFGLVARQGCEPHVAAKAKTAADRPITTSGRTAH